jgi:hypothetical protein
MGTRQRDQLGFLLAVKNRRHRRCRALLAAQDRLEALFDQLPAHPVDHRWAGIQRIDDAAVAPSLAEFRDIGFEQNPRLQQPLRRTFPFTNQPFKLRTLLTAQPQTEEYWGDVNPANSIRDFLFGVNDGARATNIIAGKESPRNRPMADDSCCMSNTRRESLFARQNRRAPLISFESKTNATQATRYTSPDDVGRVCERRRVDATGGHLDTGDDMLASLLAKAVASVPDPLPGQLRGLQRLEALRHRLATNRYQLAVLG